MIQSVHRALQILTLFSIQNPSAGLSEIARFLDLPKPTVHGLIQTLKENGFLEQDEKTRTYHLGQKIYELGTVFAGCLEINQKAGRPLHELAGQVGLVGRVAIWSGDFAMAVLNVVPQYSESLSYQIGPRVEGYCSSIGRAILAFLDPADVEAYLDRVELIPFTRNTICTREGILAELEETRRRGYALNREEMVLGRASMAAPVFRRGKQVAGAVSLTGDPARILGEESAALAGRLMRTAEEISRGMGHFPEFHHSRDAAARSGLNRPKRERKSREKTD